MKIVFKNAKENKCNEILIQDLNQDLILRELDKRIEIKNLSIRIIDDYFDCTDIAGNNRIAWARDNNDFLIFTSSSCDLPYFVYNNDSIEVESHFEIKNAEDLYYYGKTYLFGNELNIPTVHKNNLMTFTVEAFNNKIFPSVFECIIIKD